MKIIAIDAIDINSFGGLVHLEQITKVLSQKKLFIKVYSNSFVKNNLKLSKNVSFEKNSIFDKNFLIRHFWKILFFKKDLEKRKCKVLLSLNGIYHGLFKPTILLQQNMLPFDNYANENYKTISRLKFFFQKIAVLISIKLHRNIIFTSKDLRNKILKNLKHRKFLQQKVIYHGVEKINNSIKKNFTKNNNKFLYVSEFQKYKNHELLFEALKKNKSKKKFYLTCIGRYNNLDIRKLKKNYNFKKLKIKVKKISKQKNILKIYKNYDAIIFPSLCESFGLPLLEAASKKVPILCSNLRVFKEIYGNGCIYFDPKNIKSIIDKIILFSTLKEKEIKFKVKSNYLKSTKLSWNYSGNEYHKVISNVIKFYEKKN
jgi:glycosyltransferase involved in cell wall biosynthesis